MERNRCIVKCVNTNSEITVVPGTTVKEVLQYFTIENKERFISAYINNKSKDLNYVIDESVTVKYIDTSHFEGARVYRRTLMFLLQKALSELYPDAELKIKFSIGHGAYFEINGIDNVDNIITELKSKISNYVESDISIDREFTHIDDIKRIFLKNRQTDKVELMESVKHLYYVINRIDDSYGFFYGTLAASTGQITNFDIEKFYDGFVIVVPVRGDNNQLEQFPKSFKLHSVFNQHKKWVEIVDVATIGQLNKKIDKGEVHDLVKIGEALHEKELSRLADTILEHYNSGARSIFISGPSSSGKTTSSYRLGIQLRVLGLTPVIIGMDNYFVNRDDTPLDDKGRYNYECLEAIDVVFFNQQLNELMEGKEVDIPHYDFIDGRRKFIDNKMKLGDKSIIIVEGIHALNPKTTALIPSEKMYKIYVSAMTSLSMDNTSYISTTDNRLMRRIIRDYHHRGCSALDTLRRWGSVRHGEEMYIFPYQDMADYQFNSSLFFEIGVLRPHLEPLLFDVPPNTEEYSEAVRLLKMLEYFRTIPSDIVPSTSLLKEFIGGSSFEIK